MARLPLFTLCVLHENRRDRLQTKAAEGAELMRWGSVAAPASPSATRPRSPPSTRGFERQTEFANCDRCNACVDPPLSFVALVQERTSFAQEGNCRRQVRPNASRSDVPRLRYVRGPPSFAPGTNVVPNTAWETLMSWKTPKIVEVPVGMEINMYACAARK